MEGSQTMGIRVPWIIGAVVAALTGAAALGWHFLQPNPVRATETAVRAADEIVARGRLEPRDGLYEISAFTLAATASVGEILVRENDTVAKGALLATLASHDQLKTQVKVAEASLDVSERNLEFIRKPYKTETIAALEATIKSRAADLDLAQRRVKRSTELVRKDAATIDDHETRIATVERSDALVREAEARLKAETEVSDTELQRAIAQVAESRARLIDARAQQALTEIRAPTDGTILRIHAKPGEMLSGRAIMEMGDIQHPRAIAEVDERFIPNVRVGQKAQISLPGGKRSWNATVAQIRGLVLDISRTPTNAVTVRGGRIVEVRLTIDDPAGLPPISGLELVVRINAS
jgi:HlyD family secretion protein